MQASRIRGTSSSAKTRAEHRRGRSSTEGAGAALGIGSNSVEADGVGIFELVRLGIEQHVQERDVHVSERPSVREAARARVGRGEHLLELLERRRREPRTVHLEAWRHGVQPLEALPGL